jgi:predicted MFS family arabinose efflux permease
MLAAIRIILRTPSIRAASISVFATGLAFGATMPYFSIVGIREFGMSDQMLSLLLFATSLASLIYGVSIAIFSDMVADRRRLLLGLLFAGAAGYGLIYLVPHIGVFVVSAVLLVPLAGASYSLLFASIRALTLPLGAREAGQVNQVVRSLFSAAWVLAPGFIALWLAGSDSMLPAWGLSALACLFCLAVTLLLMPPLPRAADAPRHSFFDSLRTAASPRLLARITAVALIVSTSQLVMVIQPLIITSVAGGGITDVGLIAGACALLEIPFMLIWGMLLSRLSVVQALGIGALIYASFMAALSFATAPWQIYLLLIPNALGLSAIISLPLNYYQNLLVERPGLGTGLNQISFVLSTGLSAGAFAAGGYFLTYSQIAWIGVATALAGTAWLFTLERPPAEVTA